MSRLTSGIRYSLRLCANGRERGEAEDEEEVEEPKNIVFAQNRFRFNVLFGNRHTFGCNGIVWVWCGCRWCYYCCCCCSWLLYLFISHTKTYKSSTTCHEWMWQRIGMRSIIHTMKRVYILLILSSSHALHFIHIVIVHRTVCIHTCTESSMSICITIPNPHTNTQTLLRVVAVVRKNINVMW